MHGCVEDGDEERDTTNVCATLHKFVNDYGKRREKIVLTKRSK